MYCFLSGDDRMHEAKSLDDCNVCPLAAKFDPRGDIEALGTYFGSQLSLRENIKAPTDQFVSHLPPGDS